MTNLGFLIFYVLGMVPTYILPYFGSNSYVAQAAAAGIQALAGITPTTIGLTWTILHFGALAVCALAAWARGKTVGKAWIVIFPVIAALFDLAPGLSMVPMVPTILHVVVLIFGFQAKEIPEAEADAPDQRLIMILLAAIIGGSVFGAGANFTYAKLKMQHEIKVAQEREAKRVDDARVAAENARAAKAEADAKKAAEDAEIKAKQQKELDDANAKFKEIEANERTKFETEEKLISAFSNTEIQTRLNNYATNLNKGNAKAAAAALGVDPMQVYSAAQSVVVLGGITGTRLDSFNAIPSEFKFVLKYPDFQKTQAPTGYEIQAKHTVIEARATLIAARSSASYASKDQTSCLGFTYRLSVDSTTGQLTGTVSNLQDTSNCSRR